MCMVMGDPAHIVLAKQCCWPKGTQVLPNDFVILSLVLSNSASKNLIRDTIIS